MQIATYVGVATDLRSRSLSEDFSEDDAMSDQPLNLSVARPERHTSPAMHDRPAMGQRAAGQQRVATKILKKGEIYIFTYFKGTQLLYILKYINDYK